MKMTINDHKRIGNVIYIVEGDVDEPEMIINLFNQFLGYSIIKYSKITGKYTELINNKDKYSKVFIIPAKYSATKKILDTFDYFDEIYHTLAVEYNLDVENSSIYYIFDRDRKSNRQTSILKLIDIFKNSRENDEFMMNGLFLLSYPSIEALYCNCNLDNVKLANGMDAKENTKKYKNARFDSNLIKNGATYLINKINEIIDESFDVKMLDCFNGVNKKVFIYEENNYHKNNNYDTLSLFLTSLIDLGIIEIEK